MAVFQDMPEKPTRFVIGVSTKIGLSADDSHSVWLARVQKTPEVIWLETHQTDFDIWRTDWDIYGSHAIVNIKDKSRAALFKLTFA